MPAHWVIADGPIRAFLDHRPLFPGHTLVVPADHIEHLNVDARRPDRPALDTVRAVSRAMVDVLGAEGSFTATNTVVSQSVPHLHVHVVPRRPQGRAPRVLLAPHEVRLRRGGGRRSPRQLRNGVIL